MHYFNILVFLNTSGMSFVLSGKDGMNRIRILFRASLMERTGREKTRCGAGDPVFFIQINKGEE